MSPATIGSVEAERAFLGCLMQLGALDLLALGPVEPADFTDPRHAAILDAILVLFAAGQPSDPVTVLGQLRRSGLERSMTADRDAGVFLVDLLGATPSVGNAGHYLTILLEHRVRRDCARLAERITQAAEHDDLDVLRAAMNADLPALGKQWVRLNARTGAA
jgi:replicative DNA helicase